MKDNKTASSVSEETLLKSAGLMNLVKIDSTILEK